MSKPGFVYVMSNPGMPGLVKVGHTTGHPQQRAQALHTTGVPFPFKVEYAEWTNTPQECEGLVHSILGYARAYHLREFFRATPSTAKTAVRFRHDLSEMSQARPDITTEALLIRASVICPLHGAAQSIDQEFRPC